MFRCSDDRSLQRNMSAEEGSKVIRRSLELGVNFIDTAELYDLQTSA